MRRWRGEGGEEMYCNDGEVRIYDEQPMPCVRARHHEKDREELTGFLEKTRVSGIDF